MKQMVISRYNGPTEEAMLAKARGFLRQFELNTGGKIIDLTGGSMRDALGAPQSFKSQLIEIIPNVDFRYGAPNSIPSFLRAIDDKLRRETGISVLAQGEEIKPGAKNIVLCPGNTGATGIIERVMKYTVDLNSALFVPEFAYGPIKDMIKGEHGTMFAYNMKDDGQPDIEHLRTQLKKAKDAGFDLKFIYVNSPSNPTGVVYEPETLKQIKDLAKEFGVFILADEVYFLLVKPEAKEKTKHIASLLEPDDKDKVPIIQIGSLSKEYQMCSARMGWACFINCDNIKEMIELRNKIYTDVTIHLSHVTPLEELAALILYSTKHIEPAIAIIREREAAVAAALTTDVIQLKRKLDGGFYGWLTIDPNYGNWQNDGAFAEKLALNKGIGVTPGMAFYCGVGTPREQHVRLALVEPPQVLSEAVTKIQEFALENRR